MSASDATVYHRRDFYFYLAGMFLITTAIQVQSVAIGWQIYAMVHTPLALGIVGLCQFLPMFFLILPAGEICDRTDQRKVMAGAALLEAICALLFLYFSHAGVGGTSHFSILPFYGVLILFGVARAFTAPTEQSLIAFLVPKEKLTRAIALNSTFFSVAVICGPAIGGFLYALGPKVTYTVCTICYLVPSIIIFTLGGRKLSKISNADASRMERVKEGVRFVRNRPIVLGAISLDLFAVLLGGATALLPVFAKDILHTGPEGLGLLRSAPAVGAAVTAFLLAHRPIERHTGPRMFAAVAVFGIATIVFGLSHNFLLSFVALLALGASDMISVFIRRSMIQIATPDQMRGRVGAVNMLFISASNELGEFESGITAFLFGTIPAVVIGGLGTLGVVALWRHFFPSIRNVDRLHEVAPTAEELKELGIE